MAVGIGSAVVVAVLVVGVATGVLPGRAALTGGVPTPTPAITSTQNPSPSPSPEQTSELTPVLRPADVDADGINSKRLAARINRVARDDLGTSEIAIQVSNAGTGRPLYREDAKRPMIPASTTKVLTAAAALELLGPTHRFSTRVVAGSGSRIVLVGGGDPYLAGRKDTDGEYPRTPSLEELAVQTAKELRRQDRGPLRLVYDTSLFTGPAWNPDWTENYRSYVAPTSALWADGARLDGAIGSRHQDPARVAAKLFADELRKRGIKVRRIEEGTAGDRADQLAVVQSLRLEVIVERMLMTSDNDAAEVIFRQVAVADGRKGSITAAATAVRATLAELGVRDGQFRTYDGSGMNRENRISADVLTQVVGLATSGEHPNLAPVLTGLPVAGVEGSLSYRFTATRTEAGHGRVRAKTGTLSQVNSLAGYVQTNDGQFLSYAVIVNDTESPWAAIVWLDRVSTAISRCGCS